VVWDSGSPAVEQAQSSELFLARRSEALGVAGHGARSRDPGRDEAVHFSRRQGWDTKSVSKGRRALAIIYSQFRRTLVKPDGANQGNPVKPSKTGVLYRFLLRAQTPFQDHTVLHFLNPQDSALFDAE